MEEDGKGKGMRAVLLKSEGNFWGGDRSFLVALNLILALVAASPAVQVQAEHGLLRIQGEAASSWTEERQRGGAEAVDKEEERSAAWPTSLDMTLPLERSSKPEGLPDNVLFQSIRNSYEGRVEKLEHNDNSSDPDPVVKRSWSVGEVSSIAALGLGGGFSLLLVAGALASLLCSRRRRLRKADSMDRSFLSDSYSASYNGDSETFNSISYADCAGIEMPKDNSSEELYNLDNDSFLNSLEAISFPDTWPEAKL